LIERGYLYVAAGAQKYIDEASISARSLKQVVADAHVTLISDHDFKSDVFDNIVVRTGGDFSSYRAALAYRVDHVYDCSPYKYTFAVDTDTYFCESCEPLFDLLEYFDLCMASAPGDMHVPVIDGKKLVAYTPYNCGAIAFRKNVHNAELFAQWRAIYREKLESGELEKTKGTDQTSFMQALLHSPSRVYVMANIWNARTTKYIALKDTVKLVHGRHENYEQIKQRLNPTRLGRCWDPKQERCLFPSLRDRLPAKIMKRLRRKKGA
jgi:hypothetical protein